MLDTTSNPGVNVELHEKDGWILMQRKVPIGYVFTTTFDRNWT